MHGTIRVKTLNAEEPDCKPIAGLTLRGAWLASRLPVPQGAKQAEYHRSSHKMEFLLLWHLETGRQLVPVHQKMEGSTCKPGACLIPNLGQAQKMDLRFGECFRRSIFSHFGIRWQQNLVNFFIYVRVYYLATVEWSGFLPGSSLSPLALKQQQTIIFYLLLAVVLWQLHEL